MASKAPKWPRKADEQAQWLRTVIEPTEQIDDEARRFLEKGLAGKSGRVVATAAAICGTAAGGRAPARERAAAVTTPARLQGHADEQAHQDRRPSRRSGRGAVGSGAG